MIKKHFNIPIFIPEAACPFQCIYCNQRKISGRQKLPGPDEIIHTIETHLQTIPVCNTEIELAYFGGNFTGFSLEDQRLLLSLARPYIHAGQIKGIRLSTRPDNITPEILSLLNEFQVKTIELGAQSMDDEVLRKTKRGHTAADTESAAQMIREAGFTLGLQMMIGLPGDTLEKAIYTARRIAELGAAETRIYPTLVIRDTLLEKYFHEGKYTPLPLEEAVRWSAKLLTIFEQAGVKVLKLGLHSSEGLLSGNDLVAGPWHPSFRELVLTEIWQELLEKIAEPDDESILIEVPEREINYAVGYGGGNKKWLEEKFRTVKFRGNKRLQGRDFRIIVVSN